MSKIGDMKQILKEMENEIGLEIGVVITRNGIPMVWNAPEDKDVETFATLSATIYGASEVVYSGLGKNPPELVMVEGGDGTFVARALGKKGVLSGISREKDRSALVEGIKIASEMLKEVL